MYYAALVIYAVLMGVLAPPLVNLYLQYAKESTAPYLIQIHPYRIPFIVFGGILILGAIAVVTLGIREHRRKQKKGNEIETIIRRLDDIEKRLPK